MAEIFGKLDNGALLRKLVGRSVGVAGGFEVGVLVKFTVVCLDGCAESGPERVLVGMKDAGV